MPMSKLGIPTVFKVRELDGTEEGVFRLAGEVVPEFKTISGDGRQRVFIFDEGHSGGPIGFMIKREHFYKPGLRLSQYVRSTPEGSRFKAYSLDVVEIGELDDIADLKSAAALADKVSKKYMEDGKMVSAMNVLEAFLVPSTSKIKRLRGEEHLSFEEQTGLMKKYAIFSGVRIGDISPKVKKVLDSKDIGSAIDEVKKLERGDAEDIVRLTGTTIRMEFDAKKIMHPEIQRLQIATLKRLAQIM